MCCSQRHGRRAPRTPKAATVGPLPPGAPQPVAQPQAALAAAAGSSGPPSGVDGGPDGRAAYWGRAVPMCTPTADMATPPPLEARGAAEDGRLQISHPEDGEAIIYDAEHHAVAYRTRSPIKAASLEASLRLAVEEFGTAPLSVGAAHVAFGCTKSGRECKYGYRILRLRPRPVPAWNQALAVEVTPMFGMAEMA